MAEVVYETSPDMHFKRYYVERYDPECYNADSVMAPPWEPDIASDQPDNFNEACIRADFLAKKGWHARVMDRGEAYDLTPRTGNE